MNTCNLDLKKGKQMFPQWILAEISGDLPLSFALQHSTFSNVSFGNLFYMYLFFNWKIIGYNVMFVSAVQCKSVITIFVYLYTQGFPGHSRG